VLIYPIPRFTGISYPRYKHKIEFKGLKFDDPDFGYILRPIERKIPENVMKKITEEIKRNL